MTVPPRMQPLGPSTGVLGGWRAVRRPTPRPRPPPRPLDDAGGRSPLRAACVARR